MKRTTLSMPSCAVNTRETQVGRALLLVLALALLSSTMLLPGLAEARFIMLDTNFDNRVVGSSLQRRGALYGEPVEGLMDDGCEVVVADGPGDNSVLITDSADDNDDPCYLYWRMRDDRVVEDGQLTISFELQPDVTDNYEVIVRGPQNEEFFHLELNSVHRAFWKDHDSPVQTLFAFYTSGDLAEIQLVFDLEAGTYDFFWNGTQILDDESNGLAGGRIVDMLVGTAWDPNVLGALRFDNPSIDWRPGTAEDRLRANFNDQPVDQVIGTGGAELGQPISYVDCTPTVRTGVFPTPSLEMEDESDYATGSCRFEFLESAEILDEPVSVSFWLAFESLDEYEVAFREQGGSSRTFMNLIFQEDGDIVVQDEANMLAEVVGTYPVGTPFRVEVAFMMGIDAWSLWVDDERLMHRRGHGIDDRGLGRVVFQIGHDPDYDGRMRIDSVKVQTLGDAATPVEGAPGTDTPLATTAQLIGAAPNPFNPQTTIAFALPRAGRARLEVFDARGRRIARLMDDELSAGEHRAVWRGMDEAGRRVASGVYLAKLTVDGFSQGMPLTMIK